MKTYQKTYAVTITGETPLLMHADNIDWADLMEEWKNTPANKATSKAGDDRTPPWRWIGCLNYDDPKKGVVTIPSEYIMRSIMGGAAMVPTGKKQGTFKALSQSGMLCADFQWPLTVNGKTIPMAEVNKGRDMATFPEQVALAERLGFELFKKRAKVGTSKHIRVRPRFDKWQATGKIIVTEAQITKGVLESILELSGRLKGLGDWRPGGATPGPWGTYTATVEEV